jgi:hypothetical protein
MRYQINRSPATPQSSLDWDGPAWREIPSLAIEHFHPAGSDHRPLAQVKLFHTGDALHVLFRVRDRYVKSVATQYQQMVCNDSCVELFVQPKPDRGYFNFEINCCGTMLLYHIEDATRVGNAFAKYTKVSSAHAQQIQILTTMSKTTPIEIDRPTEWRLALRVPVSIMESYVGAIGDLSGQTWCGNLYKCGDETSHSHWASWAPIGEELNFHQPDKFGELRFE